MRGQNHRTVNPDKLSDHLQTGRLLLDTPVDTVDSAVALFRTGDILFGKLRPYLAKVVLTEFDGVCSAEFLVLQSMPAIADARFIFYIVLSGGFIELINSMTYGTKMPRANPSQVGGVVCPLPPLPEQRAVAAFLDRETAKIDALVAKRERLIELLQEKRAAVIAHAVTKGLDPDAPMKDSGIDSPGNILAHWEVRRNKQIFREVDERSTAGDEELLTVSHITGVTPRSEKEVYMFLAESMEGYKKVRKGDLVVNTMWAWMGALGISGLDGIVSPSYNVYRASSGYEPRYLDFLYRTPPYVCEIGRHSKGVWSSRLRLYPDEFFEIWTVTPPLSEQKAIVEHIAAEIQPVDALTAKVRAHIDKLREFRTALISAVVTGKIDVRHEVK